MAKTFPFTGADGSALDTDLTLRAGSVQITDNKLFATGTIPNPSGAVVTAAGAADDSVSAVFNAEGSNATASSGPAWRYQDGNNHWYAVITPSTGELKLGRVASGSAANVEVYTIPSFDNTASYLIEVTFLARNVLVDLNGTQVIDFTNASDFLATETAHGLKFGSTDVSLDDLTIDSLGGTAPSVSRVLLDMTDDLPASATVSFYAHKISDKTKFHYESITMTNGAAIVSLPLSDFPIGTDVHWSAHNDAATTVAGGTITTVE